MVMLLMLYCELLLVIIKHALWMMVHIISSKVVSIWDIVSMEIMDCNKMQVHQLIMLHDEIRFWVHV